MVLKIKRGKAQGRKRDIPPGASISHLLRHAVGVAGSILSSPQLIGRGEMSFSEVKFRCLLWLITFC